MKTKFLLFLLIVACLSGCGFKLKGGWEIPYETVYLQTDMNSRVGRALKKKISRKSNVDLVDQVNLAAIVVTVLGENSMREVSVLSNAGSVDEYELIYTVRYKFYSPNDASMDIESQLVLRRKITHSDLEIAAKSNEEDALISDMASEAATRILVRLSREGS